MQKAGPVVVIERMEQFRDALPGGTSRLPLPTIWRGQGDSSWPLSSSFERMYRKLRERWQNDRSQSNNQGEGGNLDIYRCYRDRYLASFKRYAAGVRGPAPAPLDDERWWALGRHFGLRTPLLDWTDKPFIALFFAVTDLISRLERTAGDLGALKVSGASCAVFRLELCDPIEALSSRGLKTIRPEVDELSRMHGQRGLFTWLESAEYLDLESFLQHHGASSYLTKFVLPDKLAIEAYRDLCNFGIDWRVLYPDLTGAALAANAAQEIPDDLWDLRY
jgi:hypothetical protein